MTEQIEIIFLSTLIIGIATNIFIPNGFNFMLPSPKTSIAIKHEFCFDEVIKPYYSGFFITYVSFAKQNLASSYICQSTIQCKMIHDDVVCCYVGMSCFTKGKNESIEMHIYLHIHFILEIR